MIGYAEKLNLYVKQTNKAHKKNMGQFFTPEDIHDYIFLNSDIKDNSIIQLISRLKRKITNLIGNNNFFIENIYNKGYHLK